MENAAAIAFAMAWHGGGAGRQATASKIWRTTLVVSGFSAPSFGLAGWGHSYDDPTMGFLFLFFQLKKC